MMLVVFGAATVVAIWLWCNGGKNPSDDINDSEDRFLFVLGVFLFLFTVALGGGAGAFGALLLGENLPSRIDEKPSHAAQLANLRSVDGVSGVFRGSVFVSTGYIGTDQYYFYYEKNGDSVTPRRLSVGTGVYVYEQDRGDAVLEVYDWHLAKPWWRWFAFEDLGRTYRLYVPKGTVQSGFTLQ